MSSLEKQIRMYIREISRNLPRNYPGKKKLLHLLEQNIHEFLEDHPTGVGWPEIMEQFGSVSDVTEAFMSEIQDEELVHVFQKKHREVFIAGVVCFLICLFLFHFVQDFKIWRDEDAFMTEETLYVYEGTECPDKWQEQIFPGEK